MNRAGVQCNPGGNIWQNTPCATDSVLVLTFGKVSPVGHFWWIDLSERRRNKGDELFSSRLEKDTCAGNALPSTTHLVHIFRGTAFCNYIYLFTAERGQAKIYKSKTFHFYLSLLFIVCVIHLGALCFGQGQAKTLLLIWPKIFTCSGLGIISDAGDQKPLVVRSKLYFPVFVSLSCTPVSYKRYKKGFVKSRIIFYIARQSIHFAVRNNCHSKIILHFEMSTFLSNISLLFSVSHCTGREVQSII